MSLRGQPRPRQPREAYFTPAWVTEALLELLPLHAMSRHEVWEPAAGAGHMARILARHFTVLASDISPARPSVHTVLERDFLDAGPPSGAHPLTIITNPPYGPSSRLALRFLVRALDVTAARQGLVAMLLPFEFDARVNRQPLAGGHSAFAAKITLGRRIRWLNLPQKEASPMGHHSWFVYAHDQKLRARLRAAGPMITV